HMGVVDGEPVVPPASGCKPGGAGMVYQLRRTLRLAREGRQVTSVAAASSRSGADRLRPGTGGARRRCAADARAAHSFLSRKSVTEMEMAAESRRAWELNT